MAATGWELAPFHWLAGQAAVSNCYFWIRFLLLISSTASLWPDAHQSQTRGTRYKVVCHRLLAFSAPFPIQAVLNNRTTVLIKGIRGKKNKMKKMKKTKTKGGGGE